MNFNDLYGSCPAELSQEDKIKYFTDLGFSQVKTFVGEYVLLMDLKYNKVRVYDNGAVWRTNHITGGYIKEHGAMTYEL